jgi:tetratricopeptide (TPR) repeat protein
MKTLDVRGFHGWIGCSLVVLVLAAIVWLPSDGHAQPVVSDPATADRWVTEGLKRAQQGDYRGAVENYDRALRVDAANAQTYAYRGYARVASGDTSGGEADLRQAIRLRIDAWTAALAKKPNDVQTMLRRGVAHTELGEYQAAIGDFDRILRLQPANAEAYYLRGNARYRKGDPTGAMADYDMALKLDAKLLPCYVARASAHAARGNQAAAAADYQAARRVTPDDQVH